VPLPSEIRGNILWNSFTQSTPVGEESFACISGALEFVVLFFETGQELVEVLIVWSMHDVRELISNTKFSADSHTQV